MTLPVSPNAISLSQVNTELLRSSTATLSMNDTDLRSLAGVTGSGTTISMSNLHGKAWEFLFNITSSGDLRTKAIAAGWNGSSKLIATVTTNFSGGLTVSGSFPNGVFLTINSGVYVVGAGGNGAYYSSAYGGGFIAATSGGTGIAVSSPVTITNNGVIAGGGGGGGAQSYITGVGSLGGTGGAGNGGAGWNWWEVTSNRIAGYGAGAGSLTSAGSPAYWNTIYIAVYSTPTGGTSYGGTGGGLGAAGGGSSNAYMLSNKVYTLVASSTAAGAGGAAITGNSLITWAATGTRYGAIS